MSTQQHPAAWAVFADNGNVRLWSTDHAEVRAFAEAFGQPLIALYPGPPAQPAPHDDPIGNACRLLRDAAQEYAEGVSVNGVPDWKNEPDTHSAFIEHITAAHRLEQWAASIGAGGVEPLRRRECLHQIGEPAGERTAKDSAIEHAEYMAQDAERLLSAINTLNAQCDEDGAAFDEAEQAQAEEAVSEAFCAMRSGIYEFRKRRDRAMRAQGAPVAQGGPIGYLAAYEVDRLKQGHDGHLRSPKFGSSPLDSDVPVYLGPLPTAGATDPWREHLADQADMIDCVTLQRAMVKHGISFPDGGMEHFRAALGAMVNRFVLHAAPTANAAPVAQGDAEDAARYRWLRARWGRIADEYDGDSDQLVAIRESGSTFEGWDVDPVSLDRAIDAAIAQAKEGASHD